MSLKLKKTYSCYNYWYKKQLLQVRMSDITKDFEQAKVQIKESLSKSYQTKASLFVNTNFNGYVSQFSKALHLMMKEPEILLFLALQWLTVSIAYFVWSQFFNWIPDEV